MRLLLLIAMMLASVPIAGCGDEVLPIAQARDRRMYVEDVKVGKGATVAAGSRIEVHYEGRLPDGSVLMSTRKNGKPHAWTIGDGSVILGFEAAVMGMARGGVREVSIPPEMHWGNGGYGGVIPEDTWIEFSIEMVSVR